MTLKKIILLLSALLVLSSCLTDSALPKNYQEQYFEEFDTPLADQVIRFGDIDNLGFGYYSDYDPFSGESIRHVFPWVFDGKDLYSTDRMLEPSGYTDSGVEADGYTKSGSQYWSRPKDILLAFTPPPRKINTAMLQIFADDFQTPYWGSKFQVTFNGQRVEELEEIINSLNQTGPTAKLVSFTVPERFFPFLRAGKLVLKIDDPTTGAGDGFAFDFFRILINPKPELSLGKIRGSVFDGVTGKPVGGAVLYINGEFAETVSNTAGWFGFDAVIPGLTNVRAFCHGYGAETRNIDVVKSRTTTLEFRLVPVREPDTGGEKIRKLENATEGEIIAFTEIIFYADSDHIKPESFTVLDGIAQSFLKHPNLVVEIAGHTNAIGYPQGENLLSAERAKRVAEYLVRQGVNPARLKPRGYGSTKLKEAKIIEANRRVDFTIIKK